MFQDNKIDCNFCHFSSDKKDFVKSCGNCFACTGCEIYICPRCSNEIIIKPVDAKRSFRKLKP